MTARRPAELGRGLIASVRLDPGPDGPLLLPALPAPAGAAERSGDHERHVRGAGRGRV